MSDEVLDDDMEIEVSDEPLLPIPTLSELLEQTEVVVAQPPVKRRPTTAASYVARLKRSKEQPHNTVVAVDSFDEGSRVVYTDEYNEEFVMGLLHVDPPPNGERWLDGQQRTLWFDDEDNLATQVAKKGFAVRAYTVVKLSDRLLNGLYFVQEVFARVVGPQAVMTDTGQRVLPNQRSFDTVALQQQQLLPPRQSIDFS